MTKEDVSVEVNKIMVMGSGTMGHGIAQAAIFGGFEVVLYDVGQQFLDRALGKIKDNVEKRFVAKGKITALEGNEILGRLSTSVDLQSAADADFVIEAAPEKLELKQEIFAGLDKVCRPQTILATNTSVLPVTAIAGATGRKDKVVGTHFFNPAAVMKLVEIVTPIGVAESTVETAARVLKQMGKVPVRAKDIPGFIVNRLLGPLYMEAAQMVLEGSATAEDIDQAMRLGAGHPMGPCELADFGGFDVIQMAQDAVFNYTHKETDRLNILYRKMLEAGRLGAKNGKGFYDYLPDGTKRPFKVF